MIYTKQLSPRKALARGGNPNVKVNFAYGNYPSTSRPFWLSAGRYQMEFAFFGDNDVTDDKCVNCTGGSTALLRLYKEGGVILRSRPSVPYISEDGVRRDNIFTLAESGFHWLYLRGAALAEFLTVEVYVFIVAIHDN